MDDLEYLNALATEIGFRIEAGNLPPTDENGFYIMDQATASIVAAIDPSLLKGETV